MCIGSSLELDFVLQALSALLHDRVDNCHRVAACVCRTLCAAARHSSSR